MNLIHGGDIYSYDSENMIDFSANINPLGMPDSVKQAIIDNIDKYKNYPDPLCRKLRCAISEHDNIPFENIVCGNGAADLIYRIVLYIKPKKALIIGPTFSEYESALKVCGCEITYYFLKEENEFIIDESIFDKITKDIDMIFVCNPNNPTGTPIRNEFMINIAQSCNENDIVLIVDECFNNFLDNEKDYTIIPMLDKFKKVIVLKAFTKMYAMAGIRLGYAFCSDNELIEKVRCTLQPWSVSIVAEKCGIAALNENDFVTNTKKIISQNREYLITELNKIGLTVYGSRANYIFFRCTHIDFKYKLKNMGILIRSCANFVGLCEGYYRIAVKSDEDNRYLIKCMQKIIKE